MPSTKHKLKIVIMKRKYDKVKKFLIVVMFLFACVEYSFAQETKTTAPSYLSKQPHNILKIYPSQALIGYMSAAYELRITKRFAFDFIASRYYYDDLRDNVSTSLDYFGDFMNTPSYSYSFGVKYVFDSIADYRNCFYIEPIFMYKTGTQKAKVLEYYESFYDSPFTECWDYTKTVYALELMLGYQYIGKYNLYYGFYGGVGGRYKELHQVRIYYTAIDNATNKLVTVYPDYKRNIYKLAPSMHFNFVFGFAF